MVTNNGYSFASVLKPFLNGYSLPTASVTTDLVSNGAHVLCSSKQIIIIIIIQIWRYYNQATLCVRGIGLRNRFLFNASYSDIVHPSRQDC
jgi:hypothetical protein